MNLTQAAEFLRTHDNYVILTHKNPDGDTVGCSAALCLALRALGKRAHVLENPGFTARFRPFLAGLTDESANGCVISTDVADAALLPANARPLSDRVELAIDHHETHRAFAPNILVDADSAACGELMLDVIDTLGVALSPEIARAIYLAIATDTGCFSFSNTTARTHQSAARLFSVIASDIPAINHTFCVEKSKKRAALEAHLISHAEFVFENACAALIITQALMQELDLCEDDLDNIASIARAIQGVELAVVVRELKDGNCKVSLRSSPRVDSAAICAAFQGGGHKCAAGCTVAAAPSDALALVMQKIQEFEVFPL